MRFLLDESADAGLVPYLRGLGHDTTTVVGNHQASLPDEEVLALARIAGRVLITEDRDFGRLVFSESEHHGGVVLFRFGQHAELTQKVARLDEAPRVLSDHPGAFIVVSMRSVRVR